jgi:hypothetical protein
MAKEWSSSKLVEALMAAGTKGMTKSDLKKKIPKPIRSKSTSILSELRSAGSIQGPFKKRSDYYFAPQFAPTRAQAEGLIEKLLRDAGLRLTTKTDLSARANGFLQVFFKDVLAALKSEAKIVELKRGRSTFYVHREAVLEQLRLTDDSEAGPPREPPIWSSRHAAVTLEDVRPIYERLKTEQGGISTVKIYDIMTRLGAAKEDLHRLLLDEAKNGRASLHRASTAKFSPEVIEAGIRLEGQPEPLVTIVLKEEP